MVLNVTAACFIRMFTQYVNRGLQRKGDTCDISPTVWKYDNSTDDSR